MLSLKSPLARVPSTAVFAIIVVALAIGGWMALVRPADAHPHWFGTTRYSLYENSGGEYVNLLYGSIATGDWYYGGHNCTHSGDLDFCLIEVDYVGVSAQVYAGNSSVHYGFHGKVEAKNGCVFGAYPYVDYDNAVQEISSATGYQSHYFFQSTQTICKSSDVVNGYMYFYPGVCSDSTYCGAFYLSSGGWIWGPAWLGITVPFTTNFYFSSEFH